MLGWDDLRYLLALSRAGSLSGAARALCVEHTTVGRRIEALESALGARLFVRSRTGYALTPEGQALLPHMTQIEEAVLALERTALGRDQSPTGTVRVTIGETIGSRFFAPRLGRLHAACPGIQIELITSASVFDLSRREADIGIRMMRQKQEGLVMRKVCDVGWSIYFSRRYAERRGMPTAENLREHERLGDALEPRVLGGGGGVVAGQSRCLFRSNSTGCLMGAALSHLGVALLPCYLGDSEPELLRLRLPDEPRRPLWLAVHPDMQHTPRVRSVLDAIAALMTEEKDLLRGAAPAARLTPASAAAAAQARSS
jgi:DNA-binding transcriptional LysR family regulator